MIADTIRIMHNDKIDLLILNDIKSILLKFIIIKEGKVIFETNHSKRVDFELKTMNDYYDFKPFIEKYNQAYLERALQYNNDN